MKTTAKAKALARRLLRDKRTYRQIAEQDYGKRIHFSVLSKIVNTDGAYIPSDKESQYLLGLYKPRPITPKTIINNEMGQSWTLYMRHLIRSMRTPTPKELKKK
jgi:hypothetical protein